MKGQDASIEIGPQYTDADGDNQDASGHVQCCRVSLHGLVIPRPRTGQPPSGDARGDTFQVGRGGPETHRDHDTTSNGKSIEPSNEVAQNDGPNLHHMSGAPH